MSTHETEWHADDTQLAAYAAGRTDRVFAASLETHLLGCATCRGRIATQASDTELAWERLADVIDRPSRPWLLRSTVATPALARAALVAVLLVGVVPLVISSGAGAEMRQALGVAVFSGMIGVTLFGLLLTPVFYVSMRRLVARRRGGDAPLLHTASPRALR